MAIGTAAAIGMGIAGVGSIIGASSSNKASKRAANVSQENNAANVALQREVYGKNQQALNPYIQRGNAAGNQMNALLGLGGTTAPAAANNNGTQPANALATSNGGRMNAAAMYGLADGMSGYNPAQARDMNPITSSSGYNWQANNGRAPNAYWQGQMNQGATPQPAQGTATPTNGGGQTAEQAANSAFDIFRNSTGYKFRLNEGYDALNSGYAGAGVLQSGAAMNAAQEYGQNFASNEFGNYMGYLGNQQGVGLSGASALAGVGQNFANSVSQQNTMNAANQANAITSRQNPFANALGMVGGGLFQMGMGR